jgi:hypothetical protein
MNVSTGKSIREGVVEKQKIRIFIGKCESEISVCLEGGEPIHGKLENQPEARLKELAIASKAGILTAKSDGKLYDITAFSADGFFTMKLAEAQ